MSPTWDALCLKVLRFNMRRGRFPNQLRITALTAKLFAAEVERGAVVLTGGPYTAAEVLAFLNQGAEFMTVPVVVVA